MLLIIVALLALILIALLSRRFVVHIIDVIFGVAALIRLWILFIGARA